MLKKHNDSQNVHLSGKNKINLPTHFSLGEHNFISPKRNAGGSWSAIQNAVT